MQWDLTEQKSSWSVVFNLPAHKHANKLCKNRQHCVYSQMEIYAEWQTHSRALTNKELPSQQTNQSYQLHKSSICFTSHEHVASASLVEKQRGWSWVPLYVSLDKWHPDVILLSSSEDVWRRDNGRQHSFFPQHTNHQKNTNCVESADCPLCIYHNFEEDSPMWVCSCIRLSPNITSTNVKQ